MLQLLSDIIKAAAKGSWGFESQICNRVPKSLLDFPSMPDCKLRLLGLLDCQLCDRNSGITFFPLSGKPRVLVSSVRHTWHIFPQPTNFSFEYCIAWTVSLAYMPYIYRLLFHLQPFVFDENFAELRMCWRKSSGRRRLNSMSSFFCRRQ